MSTDLKDELKKDVAEVIDRPKVKLSDIYLGSYKKGPVRREVTFRANDLKHANFLFERYVAMQRAKENERCVMVGRIQPLALDIEEELKKFFEETGRRF